MDILHEPKGQRFGNWFRHPACTFIKKQITATSFYLLLTLSQVTISKRMFRSFTCSDQQEVVQIHSPLKSFTSLDRKFATS